MKIKLLIPVFVISLLFSTNIVFGESSNENENQFIRINDDSFNRQSLQTGETISTSGTFTSLIIGSLGPILIVFFIVIYAVKKRNAKKRIQEKK